MNEARIRLLQDGKETNGPVIYWMSREQRVHDNWALIQAQKFAIERKKPLLVVFNLVPDFLEATIRQYGFMLKGLQEVESELGRYNIPFLLLQGSPEVEIPRFIKKNNTSVLVLDFDPLRKKRARLMCPINLLEEIYLVKIIFLTLVNSFPFTPVASNL